MLGVEWYACVWGVYCKVACCSVVTVITDAKRMIRGRLNEGRRKRGRRRVQNRASLSLVWIILIILIGTLLRTFRAWDQRTSSRSSMLRLRLGSRRWLPTRRPPLQAFPCCQPFEDREELNQVGYTNGYTTTTTTTTTTTACTFNSISIANSKQSNSQLQRFQPGSRKSCDKLGTSQFFRKNWLWWTLEDLQNNISIWQLFTK